MPHIARVYDYWLGGKDNFAADRAAAQQVIETMPDKHVGQAIVCAWYAGPMG